MQIIAVATKLNFVMAISRSSALVRAKDNAIRCAETAAHRREPSMPLEEGLRTVVYHSILNDAAVTAPAAVHHALPCVSESSDNGAVAAARCSITAAAIAVATLGVAAEVAADPAADPLMAVTDFVTGLTLVIAGVLAHREGAGATGWLLLGAAAAWFAGTVATVADGAGWLLYLHRGLLIHAALAAPRPWPQYWASQALVVCAYVAALPAAAESGWAVLGCAVALSVLASLGRAPVAATLFLATGMAVAGLSALLVLASPAADPALLTYEVAVGASALALCRSLKRRAAFVGERVVELGERAPLSAALATALGDPTIEIALPDARTRFRTASGTLLRVDRSGGSWSVEAPQGERRRATTLEHEGKLIAVLLHERATLQDPRVAAHALRATRLALENAELTAAVAGRVEDVRASSRRLLLAGAHAREDLQRRLQEGPQRRLAAVGAHLSRLPHRDVGLIGRVERAQLELDEFAAGLHPRALRDGSLADAARALAEQAPIPVDVTVPAQRYPDAIELAAYFVCAEGLANVAKYAGAGSAAIAISETDGMLEVVVRDTGSGGADPSRGSGLRGLSDRLTALGGQLEVLSPKGMGTQLKARIPL